MMVKMLRDVLPVLLMLLLGASSLSGKTYHVRSGEQGNGISWRKPFGDLQSALAVARAGDEIWVAVGTYLPSPDSNRLAVFNIPNGVKVYGGFSGQEAKLEQRDWRTNRTILSGNIGHQDSIRDNSFTIVYFDHVSEETILDGFVLSGGNANAFLFEVDPRICGAAIFNDGSHGVSSPVIRHCEFRDNRARRGGAIYNWGEHGRCLPRIEHCTFTQNFADFTGGAIFNNGDDGQCNMVATDCLFINNRSTYGGAVFNKGVGGECMPRIQGAIFKQNRTGMSGAVLFNERSGTDRVYAFLVDCQMEENIAGAGSKVENNGMIAARAAGVE
jgi:hypothetical protein